MQDKTLLFIAHWLSIICNADEIFVINAGEVAEHGTHEVLMQQGGLYTGDLSDGKGLTVGGYC